MRFTKIRYNKQQQERNKAALSINKNVLGTIPRKGYTTQLWEGCPKGVFNLTPLGRKILQITNAITLKEAVNKALVIAKKLPK